MSELKKAFTKAADDICFKIEGKRWTQIQAEIEEALADAYAAGFTAGSVGPEVVSDDKGRTKLCHCAHFQTQACVDQEPLAASYDEGVPCEPGCTDVEGWGV